MIIRLNKRFYDRRAIECALEDFFELLEGEIINEGYEVRLKLKEEIDEPIELEFKNYVLGLMKNMKMV